MRTITATCIVALLGATTILAQSKTDYQVTAVDDGGIVTGRATFRGDVPEPREFTITVDSNACGEGQRLVDVVEVSDDGGLAGVIVEIQGVEAGKEWAPEALHPVVDQEACWFTSPSWVAAKGDRVELRNSDPILHNVHAYEVLPSGDRRTLFNIAQPHEGQITNQKLKLRRSNIVKLECDAHNFMHAYMYFASSPYYATSDADGGFEIGDVPPGKYIVTAWHPVFGQREAEIEVGAGTSASVDFSFTSET